MALFTTDEETQISIVTTSDENQEIRIALQEAIYEFEEANDLGDDEGIRVNAFEKVLTTAGTYRYRYKVTIRAKSQLLTHDVVRDVVDNHLEACGIEADVTTDS